MCVILVCGEKRPTPEMVTKCWNTNDHGGGVAWREEDPKTKEVYVNWEKGLTLEEMQTYCADLPLPFIAHFRIASTGGKEFELNHPFEVSPKASVKLSGRTKNGVLFHNGTWQQWRSVALDFGINRSVKFPEGPWSDTRVMAWITSYLGAGVLEFINERTVLFEPKSFSVFGEKWEEVDGIPCSNKLFLNTFPRSQQRQQQQYPSHQPPQQQSGGSTVVGSLQTGRGSANSAFGDRPIISVITQSEKTGGSSHPISFRGSIEVIRPEVVVEKQAQEDSEGSRQGNGPAVSGVATRGSSSGESEKTVVMGPAVTPDQAKAISEWKHAASQNPKRYSGQTPVANVEADLVNPERHRRIDATGVGIGYLGRY